MPLQARSVSSDGLSRHGSGSMPEAGGHSSPYASQLHTAPSSSTQAASVDGELCQTIIITHITAPREEDWISREGTIAGGLAN